LNATVFVFRSSEKTSFDWPDASLARGSRRRTGRWRDIRDRVLRRGNVPDRIRRLLRRRGSRGRRRRCLLGCVLRRRNRPRQKRHAVRVVGPEYEDHREKHGGQDGTRTAIAERKNAAEESRNGDKDRKQYDVKPVHLRKIDRHRTHSLSDP